MKRKSTLMRKKLFASIQKVTKIKRMKEAVTQVIE
jgi:hypothetical protein